MTEGETSRVGRSIADKYQLLRLIGSGGMGAVYEAENNWTKRRVAIKVMRSDFTANKEAVRRFMQEAQSATQIAHPNIVDVLDMGQDPADGSMYIVQEFLSGTELRARLEEATRLSPTEAIEILLPVMDALVEAHKRGIVHRDVKPENIILAIGKDGRIVPKLIDFGISKVSGGENDTLVRTRAGDTIGTPHYMSPEQARGDTDIDARADVWSVGAVLFELLSGECPYDAPNYNVLIAQILTSPPRRLETIAWDVPEPLVAIVHKALETDRTLRYADMNSFRNALAEFASSSLDWVPSDSAKEVTTAKPGSVPPPPKSVRPAVAARSESPVAVIAASAPVLAPSAAKTKPIVAAALALFVLVAAFTTVFLLRRGQAPRHAVIARVVDPPPTTRLPVALPQPTPVAFTPSLSDPAVGGNQVPSLSERDPEPRRVQRTQRRSSSNRNAGSNALRPADEYQ